MLAQNFQRPADLGLTNAEFESLVKVLNMLDREEIPHGKMLSKNYFARPKSVPVAFQMVLTKSNTNCGTACCFMGWARHLTQNDDLFRRVGLSEDLADLFAIGGTGKSWFARASYGTEKITPAQGAMALRNYLNCGEPRWHDVLTTET